MTTIPAILRTFSLLSCACLATVAQAQDSYDIDGATKRFDVSAQAGYQVSPTFAFGATHQKLTDSGSFGGSLGWRTASNPRMTFRSELFYLYQPSGFSSTLQPNGFGLDIHYIQAAALYELGNQRVRGFFSVGAGATVFHPRNGGFLDQWLFSVSATLGVKVKIIKNFGLRGQARVLVPMYFTGGGLFCGYGGCSVAVSGAGAIMQADFTAGPYFEFG